MNSHELNSIMLFVHPPLAIVGYVFVFLFAITLLFASKREKSHRFFGTAAWVLTFLGLITGMIWAQSAWGSYWSWDPKETLTLLLFGSISISLISYYEKKLKLANWLSIVSCILSIITLSSSFIITGLHSFI